MFDLFITCCSSGLDRACLPFSSRNEFVPPIPTVPIMTSGPMCGVLVFHSWNWPPVNCPTKTVELTLKFWRKSSTTIRPHFQHTRDFRWISALLSRDWWDIRRCVFSLARLIAWLIDCSQLNLLRKFDFIYTMRLIGQLTCYNGLI